MLTRQDIESRIRDRFQVLHDEFKVERIGIFGSYAENAQTEESDVDILVEYYETPGLDFFDLKEYLEQLFGKRVDLVTKNALKPLIRDEILRQVIYP
jgi:uncharacterized protein